MSRLKTTVTIWERDRYMSKPIFILNGPNLNLLGEREPDIYGSATLTDIDTRCSDLANKLGYETVFHQSNIEGEIVSQIQSARIEASALIINPAAYTHTSIAIYDALKTLDIPIIEVHLSQPAARESFRRRSYVSEAATGTISGFGEQSYYIGLNAVIDLLSSSKP